MRLDDKVNESAGFPKAYFGTTDPLEDVFYRIGMIDGKSVLMIAGSGDSPLSALVRGAARVTAVDISDRALLWTQVKVIAAARLDDGSYASLMTALNPNSAEFDLSGAKAAFERIGLPPEMSGPFKSAFDDEVSLRNFQKSFFYTTRNYDPSLSPDSFVRPKGSIALGNLVLKKADVRDCFDGSFDVVLLSNVLDVFFTEGRQVRFFHDGTPDYSDMPRMGSSQEKHDRVQTLRDVYHSLPVGGKAASVSFGYFRPFIPDFIQAGQMAGFDVSHHEVDSIVYGKLMDHILVYEKY